jgi:biopolymer transport protein ExbD
MSMKLPSGAGSGDPDVMTEINTTPLIDVMLVLLVMLIITIPIQRHEVNLDMPVGAPLSTPVDVVTINVDFDGTIAWNGQVMPDQATLERNLHTVATATPQPEVHVRPNKLVPFKHVAMILASARRLDVAKIGLVGNEQW